MSADTLRRDLARLVRALLEETRGDGGEPIAPRISAHLGPDARTLPIHRDDHPAYDLPNVQLAIESVLADPAWGCETLGVAGEGKRYSGIGLGDLVTGDHWTVGPPEFTAAAVGPGGLTHPCHAFSLLLLTGPPGPVALLVRLGEADGMGGATVGLHAASPVEGAAVELLADLRRRMAEVDVFRGQVLTVEVDAMSGAGTVAFVRRPVVDPGELVLPDGVLDRIERHLVGPSRHREALLAAGRHLGRGLLLWGPPGTGKTLTVRYLTGRLTGATVIILSGGALAMAGAFGTLARRLSPAVVVLEDVDLVAEERGFSPFGGGPVLFELMNEMSGQAGDADVAFVLTTNRPDVLEPALAARPGRVDLAVEIPMPDASARRRLLELYARGMDLRLDDPEAVVARTEGVTASFLKELLRASLLEALEAGEDHVGQAAVERALGEMLHESAALTRVLLGAGGPGERRAATHPWLEEFPADDGDPFPPDDPRWSRP